MEMQEIREEPEKTAEDEGATGPAPEVKAEEEAEPDHYAKLHNPSEDVYSESYYQPLKAAAAAAAERLLWLPSPPAGLGCQQCATGWLALGRSCFYLSTFRLNWAESQRNCSSRGGSLAVVGSHGVQSFLTEKGFLKYWIGLKNEGSTWTWVNNTVLQKSYWADRPQEGDCGILSSQQPADRNWIRASCHASSYFICQLHV
ncbi:early activation antigen CD69 [Stegastes partitus]|uniref:Early activation antigen CD69 n=1 Tax=Stegastes partitus TaxID=144197 RepID=A0A9Y4KNN0_9TELE|nr:PREDICTED: C-type lectin domain family 2 member D [Stegastes partitus]